MHYSRVMPTVNGRYFVSTAVFFNEILKLTISLTMALFDLASNPKNADTSTATALFSELSRAVFNGDSWKLAIPALLYTLQNALQYVAVSNLDAPTFQVTNQLKIFMTAIFSMLFLGRKIDARKWVSLGVLVFGIVVVALSAGSAESPVLSVKDLKGGAAFHEARNIWDLQDAAHKAEKHLNKRSATYEGIEDDFAASNPHMSPTLGLLASAVACVISGFAGSVFEKIVKEPRSERGASIWVRNVQLSFYSIWPALFVGVLFLDGQEIAANGFFTGYNWAVWVAIILQAVGGVAVGVLVKVDNSLSKSISGGASSILTFLLSLVFFDLEVSSYVSSRRPVGLMRTTNVAQYFFGTVVTLSSLYVFNTPAEETKQQRPPQIRIPSGPEPEKQGYFDLESNMTAAKSPLRADQLSLSTSRPGTPTYERRPGNKSSENLMRMSKLH